MAEKNNKSGGGFFDIIIYGMMIVAVVYVIIQCILGNNNAVHFKLTLGIWIILAVAVADFIGPVVTGRFGNIPSKGAQLYTVYALMDALMYTGLYMFVINISMTKEPLHYIFLGISAALFAAKTVVYNKFQTILKETAVAEMIDKEEAEDDEDNIEVDTLDEDDSDDLKIIVYRNK